MTAPCSVASLAAGEGGAGTAPTARSWVVIEQPGPWGRQALLDSRLPEGVGAAVAEAAAGSGTTVLLARRPERRHGAWDPAGRRAWVACTAPGGMRMREGVLPDPRAVLAWDFRAIAAGQLPAFGRRTDEPLLLVCTHSGRDACCAIHGRALAEALADDERTWECSHLGGHRFAPTALSLPDGYVHGRLDALSARAVTDTAAVGAVATARARGRSCFPAPLQVADLAVRAAIDERAAGVLDVLRLVGGRAVPADPLLPLDADEVACEARHADGRSWQVTVTRDATGAVRPESCGGEMHAVVPWTAGPVTPAAGWR